MIAYFIELNSVCSSNTLCFSSNNSNLVIYSDKCSYLLQFPTAFASILSLQSQRTHGRRGPNLPSGSPKYPSRHWSQRCPVKKSRQCVRFDNELAVQMSSNNSAVIDNYQLSKQSVYSTKVNSSFISACQVDVILPM